MEENEDIVFVVPQEGTSISCDDFVIPKDAKAADLAHAFINFFLDAEVAAENTEFVLYLAPNSAAYPLMSEDIRNDPSIFLTPEVKAKSEVIDDVGESLALYTKMWDAVKAAE